MIKSDVLASSTPLLAFLLVGSCADLPANDAGWSCSSNARDGAIEATATIHVDSKNRRFPSETFWHAQIIGNDAIVELSENPSLPRSMAPPAGLLSLTFSIPSVARNGKDVSLPIEIRFSDGQPIERGTVQFSEHWQQGMSMFDKSFLDNRGGRILVVALNGANIALRSVSIDPTIISRGRGLVPRAEARAQALAQAPRSLCERADAGMGI